jgi:hypothetical protein
MEITCPNCQMTLLADECHFGENIECPECDEKIYIPLPENTEETPTSGQDAMIKTFCPKCEAELIVPQNTLKKQVECYECNEAILLQHLKKCEYCAEIIKVEAGICKFCGQELPEFIIEEAANSQLSNELSVELEKELGVINSNKTDNNKLTNSKNTKKKTFLTITASGGFILIWFFIGIFQALAMGFLYLGIMGFTKEGLLFTKRKKLNGVPGKIVGTCCLLLGIITFIVTFHTMIERCQDLSAMMKSGIQLLQKQPEVICDKEYMHNGLSKVLKPVPDVKSTEQDDKFLYSWNIKNSKTNLPSQITLIDFEKDNRFERIIYYNFFTTDTESILASLIIPFYLINISQTKEADLGSEDFKRFSQWFLKSATDSANKNNARYSERFFKTDINLVFNTINKSMIFVHVTIGKPCSYEELKNANESFNEIVNLSKNNQTRQLNSYKDFVLIVKQIKMGLKEGITYSDLNGKYVKLRDAFATVEHDVLTEVLYADAKLIFTATKILLDSWEKLKSNDDDGNNQLRKDMSLLSDAMEGFLKKYENMKKGNQ